MARNYLDFDVELVASGPDYEVIYRSITGQPKRAFDFPLEDHELGAFFGMFGKSQTRRLEPPEFARARAIGRRLFENLFPADLGEELRDAIRKAKEGNNGVRIRLDVSHAADLGTLPWEYMLSPENDDFLSLSNWTPVVRFLDVAAPLPATPLDGPLRIVVMISDPIERRGTLDVDREWYQLRQALEGPESRGEIEILRLPDGQLETLMFHLQDHDYHVFHYIGHGDYSEQSQDGVLALEDSRGREIHVSGSTLGTCLRDSIQMRLVVLNNCEGAAFEGDPFSGSAQSLLRKGIPAVVAMQFEITDQAAIDFARGFYTSLGKGFPVDAALAEARKVVRVGPTQIEFGSPVLYMSAENGVLFTRGQTIDIPDEADGADLDEPPSSELDAIVEAAETPTTVQPESAVAEPEEVTTAEPEAPDGSRTDSEMAAETAEKTAETTPIETRPDKPGRREAGWERKLVIVGASIIAGVLAITWLANTLFDGETTGTTTPATQNETTIASSDTTVSPTVTTSPPIETLLTATGIEWAPLVSESFGGEGGQALYDVAGSETGWVAVGAEITDDSTPAAWQSTDGDDWTRLAEDDFTEGPVSGQMRSVVPWNSGFVAVGYVTEGDRDAAVWRSTDGNTWERVSDPDDLGGDGLQEMRSVGAWQSGLVAVGWVAVDGDQNGAVWTSSDGQDWQRVADPDGVFGGSGGQRIHDATGFGDGVVAVGETSAGNVSNAVIWYSADGAEWTLIADEGSQLAGDTRRLANSVRAGPNGLLAGGFITDEERDAALWSSQNGTDWSLVSTSDVFGGPENQEVHALVAVESGWVAGGWTHVGGDKNAAMWASDGEDGWTMVDEAAAGLSGQGAQQVESMAISGSVLTAVGFTAEDIDEESTFSGMAWRGLPPG